MHGDRPRKEFGFPSGVADKQYDLREQTTMPVGVGKLLKNTLVMDVSARTKGAVARS
ncbi:hypothetical protein H6F75_08555 [Nodosilinea sp. FACHB-131]|nr:hypothetical protein [Nodosilinea sp. FACHB-131]